MKLLAPLLFLFASVVPEPAAVPAEAPEVVLRGIPELTSPVADPAPGPVPEQQPVRTDPALLGRTDSTALPVLIKLDLDSVATYDGRIEGYAATSPAVTGRPLDGGDAEAQYEDYLADAEERFTAELRQIAPSATIRHRLRTVYGGVAASVPANRIGDVLAIDGVLAVHADEARPLLTDASPGFIGAETIYPRLGGAADAGRGTIVGILDTGGWPEHPSFADLGHLDPPPGPARACEYGEGPDGVAFVCNNKLIGGQAFLDTYHAERGDEPYPGTARDGNGHGTHVGSTAAGNLLDSAPVLGAEHGPIGGVAPGAWVVHYRVCGFDSCYVSDSAAAVQQAILDGVDVLNFSIGGGVEPFYDPVSLAFLDAYAAGVLPVASAGNSGPDAGTTNHVAPWITTVAASTQAREFGSTLTLTAGDGTTATFEGVSITGGAPPAPVVMAADAPYSDPLCQEPAPAGSFDGVIVACERGSNARAEKGFHVRGGGAAGMILFNPERADAASDNHWLPAIHLADGTDFVEFMAAHEDVTGSFTDGAKRDGRPDVMATFSSRGPGELFLKPDITAPGVQILAGDVPIEGDPAAGGGPAGELFQAISGTSMSSPHVAGAALLLRALHPEWTPGELRSALTTTARPDVVKEDGSTPADPFDYGAGHLDLTVAADPALTLDETVERMVALGSQPARAVHLNLPSVNAPVMPGRVGTTRTFTNVTNRSQTFRVEVEQPAQGEIAVSPQRLVTAAGGSAELRITISGSGEEQQFGAVRLVPETGRGLPAQRLPVAFLPRQGDVTLATECDQSEFAWLSQIGCTVTATNHGYADVTADLRTETSRRLLVTGAEGAAVRDGSTVELLAAALPGARAGTPSLAPGTNPAAAWLPLAELDVEPHSVGTSSMLNFTVDPFRYGEHTYDRIGVTSNGYAVVGGGSGADVVAQPPGFPDPARPNNVLAPFWTDLDGRDADGVRVATVEVGTPTREYVVVEWQVFVAGTTDEVMFQLWLGLSGEEEIAFVYDPARLPSSPHPFEVGAENVTGAGGDSLGPQVAPTTDLVVASGEPAPGGSVSYRVELRGITPGEATVTSTMTGDALPGTTVVTTALTVS